MKAFIFDLETNGLLDTVTTIHSLVLRNIDDGTIISCADQEGYTPILTGISILNSADLLIGHNVIKYDIPVLEKLLPETFKLKHTCLVFDTLVASRLWAPELEPFDYSRWAHIEPKYKGRHSLAAWGERLNTKKIAFTEETKKETDVEDVWEKWTISMQEYCEQDTVVTHNLYDYFLAQKMDKRSLLLEHEFAKVISLQERFGFPFNSKAAYALVNDLKAKRSELEDSLQKTFPPISTERWSEKTGKQLKTKVTNFNPASRQQTSERLKEKYPEITFEKTEKGSPKVDDDVLKNKFYLYP